MLELGLKLLIAYLLGSIMGSLMLGRLKGGVDIRSLGSGNAGGTNALRTQGAGFALGVIVIDIAKGVLPVLLLPGMSLPGVPLDPQMPRELVMYGCALAAVVGHVWPVWHEFRGGKGAATAVGVVAVLAPWLVPPMLLVWLLIVFSSGLVGLATMTAALAAPLLVALGWPVDHAGFFWFALLLALLIVYTHRSNIARLRAGTENRVERLMLFRRRR
jgi:acyl phosphate:glycerol-3-phosphate acyltransferase